MIARKPWVYGSAINGREYLKDSNSFESLAQELLVALAEVEHSTVRFRLEPLNNTFNGDDPLLGRLQCKRASWHIPIDSKLLDKFFNGCMGIRAQYYLSPYHGRFMNDLLLSVLQNDLVKLASSAVPSVDAEFLRLSLMQPSAKVWISEKNQSGEKIIRASDLALSEDELQNDWLDMARALKGGEIKAAHYQLYAAAVNGVRMPIADLLEIKGAWITEIDQKEYVTPDKRDRDCQLFMFGFT